MKPLEELLAHSQTFAALSPADRAGLARLAIPRQYRREETIVHAGDVWPYLLLVEEGCIAAAKDSSEGRNLIVMTLGPGDLFWGQAFFRDGAPMLVRLEAQQAGRLYLWPRDSVLPILLQNAPALWELCRQLVGRMEWASEILESFVFQPVAGRLARLLLSHFEKAEGNRVARDLTLDEMAAWAGTTREMVCRTLYRFSDQGLIDITRTEFILTNRKGLADLAERM